MRGMNKILRLLGLSMMLILSGCCSLCKPTTVNSAKPIVITIDSSDMSENEDGSFRVSKKWMMYRMSIEQRLKIKLVECREKL